MPTLYAEDLSEGDEFEYGSHTVTEAGIVAFAEEFDPQPFHVDPDAAADSMFGGLVASGWHVASLTNRLLTDALFADLALRGGRGLDDLRFERPVRPGHKLSGTARVAELGEPDDRHGSVDVTLDVATRIDGDATALTARIYSIVAQRADD